MEIEDLFYELIRVAIGTQENLSRLPSQKEWKALYDMAMKQSLVGVCFAALQRLGADADEGFARIGISEMQYLTWMGMTAKIQQRNQEVDQQCVELQARLIADGFKNCILKGQGVASLYSDHLRGLRQSGDIDVLMWKDELSFHQNKKEVIAYAHSIDVYANGSEHHVGVFLFEKTEVEMHYAPAYFCNPFANKRFRRWFEYNRKCLVKVDSLQFYMPSTDFNIVLLLAHTFRHYMSEGVGMRQLLDYYFVLKNFEVQGDRSKVKGLFDSLNMLKFAEAVMWVMKEVFGMSDQFLICEPNERLGRKLLAHIIEGGNFGHHNKKTMLNPRNHAGRFINQVAQDLLLSFDYPAEALWAPISMIREFIRIRI